MNQNNILPFSKKEPTRLQNFHDLSAARDYLDRIDLDFNYRNRKRVAITEEVDGYPREVASIRFTPKGIKAWAQDQALKAKIQPTEEELAAYVDEVSTGNWPQPAFIPEDLDDPALPEDWRQTAEEDRFVIRDEDGNIVLLQWMKRGKNGEKGYFPITKWSDGQYRDEYHDDDAYPIWNLDKVKRDRPITVMIHEGIKAARHAQDIADGKVPGHPWGAELKDAVHIGWIGGAHAADKSDFSVLKALGVKIVYIVPDADDVGENAVPVISKQIRLTVFKVDLLGVVKPGGDLADPFLPEHFENGLYIGPAWRKRRSPATWATDAWETIGPKGKVTKHFALRANFACQWFQATSDRVFVNRHQVSEILTFDEMDSSNAIYSDCDKLSALIEKTGKLSQKVKYVGVKPGADQRYVAKHGKRDLNSWQKPKFNLSRVVTAKDLKLWTDFLAYLVPDEKERRELLRWGYTLIAKPEIRIGYAVLMQSVTQGTGKSLLGSIFAELVGLDNVSFPTTKEISGDYTGWAAFRKLVIVNELYAGGTGHRISNGLKSVITDPTLWYNEKFKVARSIENFCEMYACSQSTKAIDIEESDRRWFVPTVTETLWPKEKFAEFVLWLKGGGYEMIFCDAHNQADDFYLKENSTPMRTARTQSFIGNSKTQSHKRIHVFHDQVTTPNPDEKGFDFTKVWMTVDTLNQHARNGQRGREEYPEESDEAFREIMIGLGWGHLNSDSNGEFNGTRPTAAYNAACWVSPALYQELKDDRTKGNNRTISKKCGLHNKYEFKNGEMFIADRKPF